LVLFGEEILSRSVHSRKNSDLSMTWFVVFEIALVRNWVLGIKSIEDKTLVGYQHRCGGCD
jgi:hypothetical protein